MYYTIFVPALIVASIGQAIMKWAGLEARWVWLTRSLGMFSISGDHWVVVMTTPTGGHVDFEQRPRIWSVSLENFFCN